MLGYFTAVVGGWGEEKAAIWLTGTTDDILDKQVRRKDFWCFQCERAHNSAVEFHLHRVEKYNVRLLESMSVGIGFKVVSKCRRPVNQIICTVA